MAALPDGRVVDPTGGRADLAAGVVRLTASARCATTAAGVARGAHRGAARLPPGRGERAGDRGAGRRTAQRVAAAAGDERIAAELSACLANAAAGKAFAALDGLGLLDAVLPELTAGRGVEQGGCTTSTCCSISSRRCSGWSTRSRTPTRRCAGRPCCTTSASRSRASTTRAIARASTATTPSGPR
jgi:hypothetical protein